MLREKISEISLTTNTSEGLSLDTDWAGISDASIYDGHMDIDPFSDEWEDVIEEDPCADRQDNMFGKGLSQHIRLQTLIT